MATTLTLNRLDALTLDGTALNVEQITAPVNARFITLRFRDCEGYYEDTNANGDGGARATDYGTLDANTQYTIRVPGSNGRQRNLNGAVFFLSASVNSGVVEIEATDRGD